VVDIALHDVVSMHRPVLVHWKDHGEDYWEVQIVVDLLDGHTGALSLFSRSHAAFQDICNPWQKSSGADWPKHEVTP
jgi:hypothetical protein